MSSDQRDPRVASPASGAPLDDQSDSRRLIGIINTSPDTVDMLREYFQHLGFSVAAAFTFDFRDGRLDLDDWFERHRPCAVVYDIAPPYDRNWQLFLRLRSASSFAGCPVVVTTTNELQVRRAAGVTLPLHEIVGKPYDLSVLGDLVRKACESDGRAPGASIVNPR